MTTPAHDSVAYLPARPRLALLRKEADQLISFCLPCPLGLVFRWRRGRAICPRGRLVMYRTRSLF